MADQILFIALAVGLTLMTTRPSIRLMISLRQKQLESSMLNATRHFMGTVLFLGLMVVFPILGCNTSTGPAEHRSTDPAEYESTRASWTIDSYVAHFPEGIPEEQIHDFHAFEFSFLDHADLLLLALDVTPDEAAAAYQQADQRAAYVVTWSEWRQR